MDERGSGRADDLAVGVDDRVGRGQRGALEDERGDIRYTFTLNEPFEGGGVVTMTSVQNESEAYTIEIDPVTRLGVKYIEASGRGAPAELYETPAPGVAVLVGLSVLAAMAFSRKGRSR